MIISKEIPSTSGIYCIINTINNKRYIGQSSNLRKRYIVHNYMLRNKCHHNNHLQKAYDKYGNDNFQFIILEICDKNIVSREQYWADKFNSFLGENGYNCGKCVKSWNAGIKYTREMRKRISILQKSLMNPKRLKMLRMMNIGRKHNKEYCLRMKKNFLGKHHTKESKEALSKAQHKYQSSLSEKQRRGTHSHRMGTIFLISPSGKNYRITGIRGFCDEFLLDRAAIFRVISGKNKHHLGWKAYKKNNHKDTFIIKKYG